MSWKADSRRGLNHWWPIGTEKQEQLTWFLWSFLMYFKKVNWQIHVHGFSETVQPIESKVQVDVVGEDGLDFLQVAFAFLLLKSKDNHCSLTPLFVRPLYNVPQSKGIFEGKIVSSSFARCPLIRFFHFSSCKSDFSPLECKRQYYGLVQSGVCAFSFVVWHPFSSFLV